MVSPHIPAPDAPLAETGPAPLLLEVRRGRTRFPVRPVHRRRFLIGSGEQCHLRLAGPVQPLHAILLVESEAVTLEAVASWPPVLVNGERVDCCQLHDGDVVSLGTFELAARIPRDAAPAPPTEVDAFPDVDDTDPVDLSAAQLVERLEQDLELVEDFEQAQAAGADALLDAAFNAAGRDDHEPALTAAEGQRLADRLDAMADELDQRMARLAEREREVEQAAATLQQAQQDLTRQLEELHRRTAELSRQQALRKSA